MSNREITQDDWIELDVFLRGTDVDPQEAADRTGLVIICDEDAGEAGAPCWYGVRATVAAAKKSYRAIGGERFTTYEPSNGT